MVHFTYNFNILTLQYLEKCVRIFLSLSLTLSKFLISENLRSLDSKSIAHGPEEILLFLPCDFVITLHATLKI